MKKSTYQSAEGTLTSATRASRRAAILRGLRLGDSSVEIRRRSGASLADIKAIAEELGVEVRRESHLNSKPWGGH